MDPLENDQPSSLPCWSGKKTTCLTLKKVGQIKYGTQQAYQDHGFYSSLTNFICSVHLKQHRTGRKIIFQTHCGTLQHVKLEQHATHHLSQYPLIQEKGTGRGLVWFKINWGDCSSYPIILNSQSQWVNINFGCYFLYCDIQLFHLAHTCGLLRACTVHKAVADITQSTVWQFTDTREPPWTTTA